MTCNAASADRPEPPAAATPAACDTNTLATTIYFTLQHDFPQLAPRVSRDQALFFAQRACGTTNSDQLSATLYAIFTNDAFLVSVGFTNNTQQLKLTTEEIANAWFPGPGGLRPSGYPTFVTIDTNANNWGLVSLWGGYKLLNPYTISIPTNVTKGTLKGNSTTSQPFIEIDVNERYVMRSGQEYSTPPWDCNSQLWDWHILDLPVMNPFAQIPDINFSFGYIFAPGSSTTNLTLSTVAGSSDIYADSSVGLPILRYHNSDFSNKQQVTLEFGGGFATDKNLDTIHKNVFLGGGYQGKFADPLTTTNNLPVYWFGRAGIAVIDQPDISGTNVLLNTNTGGISQPKFVTKWTPSMGTTVIVPLNKTLSLQLGGNVYFLSGPSIWNITLGASIDLAKLGQSLGTLAGF